MDGGWTAVNRESGFEIDSAWAGFDVDAVLVSSLWLSYAVRLDVEYLEKIASNEDVSNGVLEDDGRRG